MKIFIFILVALVNQISLSNAFEIFDKRLSNEEISKKVLENAKKISSDGVTKISVVSLAEVFVNGKYYYFSGSNYEYKFGLGACSEDVSVSNIGQVFNNSVVVSRIFISKFLPCGKCRQNIYRYSDKNTKIGIVNEDGKIDEFFINELLPSPYGKPIEANERVKEEMVVSEKIYDIIPNEPKEFVILKIQNKYYLGTSIGFHGQMTFNPFKTAVANFISSNMSRKFLIQKVFISNEEMKKNAIIYLDAMGQRGVKIEILKK